MNLLRKKHSVPSFLFMDELENSFSRIRNRTKYKLPPLQKGSFFSAFRRSKIKQQPTQPLSRKNSDVINFL